MQAQWNAQGAQRRRRLLIDDASSSEASTSERTQGSGNAGSGPQKGHSRPAYDPEVLEGQPRVTDLIPQNRCVIALLMLFWMSMIAGIVYLHTQLDRWSGMISQDGLAPFDLAGVAGVATWFSSATLLLAAIGSWQVYNIRRHKTDDYRGIYRLWFWVAAWLVLASLEVTAGIRVWVQELSVQLSGSQLAGNDHIWWLLAFGLPSLALGVRSTFEMRNCKAALTFLVAAGLAYAYAVVLQSAPVPLEPQLIVIHRWSAVLAAHSLLLATTAIYARHVLLDARGRVVKQVKARKQKPQHSRQASSKAESTSDASENKQPKKPISRRNKKKSESPKVKPQASEEAASAKPAEQPADSKRKVKASAAPPKQTERTSSEQKTANENDAASASGPQTPRPKSKKQLRREQAEKARQKQQQQQSPAPTPKAAETRTPANQQKPKSAEPNPDFTEIIDGDEQEDFRRLTKAERRKMRKLRRNESRRAA